MSCLILPSSLTGAVPKKKARAGHIGIPDNKKDREWEVRTHYKTAISEELLVCAMRVRVRVPSLKAAVTTASRDT